MTEGLSCNIRRLLLSLLVVLGFSFSLFSQTKINGIINKYGRVTSIGTDNVIVDDATQFAQFSVGDTVLLMQMKGVNIYATEDVSYGMPESSLGPSGMHEFLIVESVESVAKRIVFRNNIVNAAFNVDGDVQIIKVPSFNNALVDATLSCQPWDSTEKRGGVLALIIGNTLSLNADINVSGKGFKGGDVATGLNTCVQVNETLLSKYAYAASTDSSGFKGESPVTRGRLAFGIYPKIYPGYAKGKGANFTGGGGGNGKYSGGGGGANIGAGGKGGRESNSCLPTPSDGGLGGKQIKFTLLEGGMFLGGGGGSSTYETGATPSPGGYGGGIVIVVCDTLKGNARSILSDGMTPGPLTASGNAGAGGGGGGGTIALYLQSFSTSNLNISVRGGNGGNNAGSFGEGGGGGGGLITTNNVSSANATKTFTGGTVGTRVGGSSGSGGGSGESNTSFVPILNGFLFNSIRSSVNGTQVDSICSNVIPKTITGTSPVGGSGSYTYLWQKSYNLAGPAIDIPSSNVLNYTPAAVEPAGNVWFRRIVKDDVTLLTDTSKWVKIIVQPAITGNLVGKDTTICYGQNPLSLIPLNSGPSNGNGIYSYQWLQNLTDTDWTTSPGASGTSTLASYDPPSLTTTTYYKRLVTSGRCIDYSSTVTVTVLPLITGNITTRSDSVICEGSVFDLLNASAVGGGAGTYTYQWQDSAASVSGDWLPASGINTNQTHSPDTSKFTVTDSLRFFRRVVYSGPYSVCKSISSPIRLTRYPKIINNIISADNTTCSGSVPEPLTGTTPLQGSLIYTYIWQDSIKNGSWTDRGTLSSLTFSSGLTDTTWYRRIVNSSECTNKSNMLVINVHKPILNNTISLLAGGMMDTTICRGVVPNLIKGGTPPPSGGTEIPGDYAYQWSSSPDNSNWTDITSSGTGTDYQPTALTATTYYRRRVISGECTDESEPVNITVLPLITNNAVSTFRDTICKDEAPDPLTQTSGLVLSGGAGTFSFLWEESSDGTSWNPAAGTNNASNGNYQPPALSIPMTYRRIVMSGAYNCCIDTSNTLDIAIDSLPGDFSMSAGPDTTLYTFDYIIYMTAEPVYPGGKGKWELVSGTGKFTDSTYNLTRVDDLSLGLNRFLWTVQLGACIREDIVDVNVKGILVPKGISPNGDSSNDILEIKGLDLNNQIAELIIINSAGAGVFSATNRNGAVWKDWDGRNSKGVDLPEGTYYYLLKLISTGNNDLFRLRQSGFIILKRN